LQTKETKSLVERDGRLIWHPYTQHHLAPGLLPISRGKGLYLYDEHGNAYMDAISSWWTTIHGHAHPHIAAAIYKQASTLEHVIFAGCTHEPAVQLAERLQPILPGEFSKFFYSDNGSTAVEVAIKMAIQYHRNNGQQDRKKILALKNAYHGDTFGAMSVSGRSVFSNVFNDYLFDVSFIDISNSSSIEKSLANIDINAVAAFIYEPMVQGAGGMNMMDAGLLNGLLKQLTSNGVLCIADEVMTGFGRTGKLFASEWVNHAADIICLSKGLTGGTMPLAITACTEDIFNAFLSNDAMKTLFHGHSYTGNPLACAAALASLDLLLDDSCKQSINKISDANNSFVKKLLSDPRAIRPRSLGTILAFELASPENEYLSTLKTRIIKMALDAGILLRPLGNTVYIMPPYCITEGELERVYRVLVEILKNRK
jgi:adenosylmethionine-8-amino-7-oxononanoate aminotransferase